MGNEWDGVNRGCTYRGERGRRCESGHELVAPVDSAPGKTSPDEHMSQLHTATTCTTHPSVWNFIFAIGPSMRSSGLSFIPGKSRPLSCEVTGFPDSSENCSQSQPDSVRDIGSKRMVMNFAVREPFVIMMVSSTLLS